MRETRYLIVGGGIAGTTAAETIRKNDTEGSIIIVSDEPHRLYSRIMLSKPNFFLGKVPFERVWLKPEFWYQENKMELLAGRRACKLDPGRKIVTLDDESEWRYEKLLLAPGGYARRWEIPGSNKAEVYYLRSLDEARAIMEAVSPVRTGASCLYDGSIIPPSAPFLGATEESRRRSNGVKTAKRAIAIGGGFVSFETCEMLRLAGLEVTLIIRESHYWEPMLDEPSGRIIEDALKRGGVAVIKNAEVASVIGESAAEGVLLKDGKKIPCDMIVAGIGIQYPIAWIGSAGIKINRGILANEYLETNISGIWAAGDAAEFNDLILGEEIQLGNWVNAQTQGRIAGLNMAGKREPFRLVSFYTTQGFGIASAFVGDARPAPDRAIILRGYAESGSYGRIIAAQGEIIGATLINRTQELASLTKLIERDFRVSGYESNLSDPDFDLGRLLADAPAGGIAGERGTPERAPD